MDTHALDDARYVALTTFRPDGTRRATPVWFAGSEGHYFAFTEATSHKVRRLQADHRVELEPCDVRGRVRDDARVFTGTGRILTELEAEAAMTLLRRRYSWQFRVYDVATRLGRRLRRRPEAERVVLGLDVHDVHDRSSAP